MNCTYNYATNSALTIQIYVKELRGENWVFGAGKQKAECSTIANPESCNGGV